METLQEEIGHSPERPTIKTEQPIKIEQPDIAMHSDSDESDTSYDSNDPMVALMMEIDRSQGILPRKRKSAEPGSTTDNKRVRLASRHPDYPSASCDRSTQLPAETWHHVFTFVPPRTLGNLLRVNKLFNTYLDPSSLVKVLRPNSSTLRFSLSPLKPDAIWRISRRAFWPPMPSPLIDRTELDMWRIVCSRKCQFCLTTDESGSEKGNDAWNRGPGAKGVSPVFPFFISTCGSCIASKSTKEIDVLLSSTIPSILLPGLPAAFLTSDLHVISPQTMQHGHGATQCHVAKIYWPGQVQQIKTEFEAAKQLGSAAVEEWYKGLELRGKKAMADASRWEKWEIFGGVRQMRTSAVHSSREPAHTIPRPPTPIKQENSYPMKILAARSSIPATTATSVDTASTAVKTTASVPERPQGQRKRTREEVEHIKLARRAEIERRAGLLKPPLTPAVLVHMVSFRNALLIGAPLDEGAWERLKPLLLDQREEAEKRERERHATLEVTKEKPNGKSQVTAACRDPRQISDEEWDEVGGPVRARISKYADEIIRDGWSKGNKVTKKNSPTFAAEVLTYVRKRFYFEVAKDFAAAITADRKPEVDPPEGPWTQKLTLENMKWVFDLKIKPITEAFRKELFLCNGCPLAIKYYGLEGVIQHYAAKHTHALSLGNVVVYWRAEWPETPPFHPEPKIPALQTPASRQDFVTPASVIQPHPNYGGFSAFPGPPQGPLPHFGYGAPPTPYVQSATSYGPPAEIPGPEAHMYLPSTSYSPYPPVPPYGNNLQPGAHTPLGYTPGPFPTPQGPRAPDQPYKIRLDFMAQIARQTWSQISHIDHLPGPVKLCVTVHHIAKSFQEKFSEPAPWEIFMDGLSNHKEMRHIRSINELHCKACTSINPQSMLQSQGYSVPQLVNHFHHAHVESMREAPLDWRIDMVQLPEMSVLLGLPQLFSYNREAYDTVADALPWAFDASQHFSKPAQVNDSISPGSPGDYGGLRTHHSQYETTPHASDPIYNRAETIPLQEYTPQQTAASPWPKAERYEPAAPYAPPRVDQPHYETHVYGRYPDDHNEAIATDSRFRGPDLLDTQESHPDDRARIQASATSIRDPRYEAASHYDDRIPDPIEYELLEVRDPVQGTYFIRRPTRREVVYEKARVQQPHTRASEQANYEEYDPRYPAGP